jgi:DNA helicase-2/ATP-dependent DNA helicase PcrA
VEVVRAWLDGGARPDEVAVLTRVNAQLLAPQVALHEAGVPVRVAVDEAILGRTGARAALAYLRIGADPARVAGADVTEILRRPSRGLPQWIVRWIRPSTSLRDLRAVVRKLDDERAAARFDGVVDDLELVADAVATSTTADALALIRDRIGLGGAMGQLDGRRNEGSSHLDDLDALAQVAALHPDAGSFERWLRGALGATGAPGGVTLSTVHRVKGREWPHVVVAGVDEGLLPHRLADDVEEERRVLHVAVTRARLAVVVLADATRPSPFLDELLGVAPPPRPASPPARPRPTPDAPADGLLEALRAWRRERAARDGVPAYVVLHDRHLASIAEAGPTSRSALARCPGMGPVKLDRYGDEVLGVVAAARES